MPPCAMVQDPENRTPPLETVFLKAPLRDVEADQLCLTDAFQPTEKLVEATMQVTERERERETTATLILLSSSSLGLRRAML